MHHWRFCFLSVYEIALKTAGANQQQRHNGRHTAGQADRYEILQHTVQLQLISFSLASIKRILNLNAPITDVDAQNDANEVPETATGGAIWKVLVFDEMGRDVISSVLRVNDLRASGVFMPSMELQRALLSKVLGHNTSEPWNNAPYDP